MSCSYFLLSPTLRIRRFGWEHACSLNSLTLSVVLEHQGASIHTLIFRKHIGKWEKADLATLSIGGLTTLGIADMETENLWPLELLAGNYQTLRRLRLGCDSDLAVAFQDKGFVLTSKLTSNGTTA